MAYCCRSNIVADESLLNSQGSSMNENKSQRGILYYDIIFSGKRLTPIEPDSSGKL